MDNLEKRTSLTQIVLRFHAFFHQLDNFRTSYYLWAVPGGYKAAFERFGGLGSKAEMPAMLEDPEEDAANPDEGEG